MRPNDPSAVDSAAIIPFDPTIQSKSQKEVSDEVSTIVAIVAVTLRHSSDESPEERLADLIEMSGAAEIIEIQDAYADFAHDEACGAPMGMQALNDNSASKK